MKVKRVGHIVLLILAGLILAARLARHEEGRHRLTEREYGAILD